MLGNAVFRFFSLKPGYETFGSARSEKAQRFFPETVRENIVTGIDVENIDGLLRLFSVSRPDVVINCIGLVKQLAEADDPVAAIPVNSILPHRLARLCEFIGARFIHISTDCVFSGVKGGYTEEDAADAKDIYGRTKYLGEVDYPHAITLRTSIIGHELEGARSLVGWFLAQQGCVSGFERAIFSGLPAVELAQIISDYVIPYPRLHGLYHVSADPINKFDLLTLIAREYKKDIEILPDNQFAIDRSLDSTRFRAATGFQPRPWVELLRTMREFG